LVPRNQQGAVLEAPGQVIQQATEMISHGAIKAITGEQIPIRVDTLCLHGDHPEASAQASLLNQALCEAGIDIRSPA
jgi:UPF0271 protein